MGDDQEREALTDKEIRRILETPPDPLHVHFDLEGQLTDALELTIEHLRRLPDRPMSWKWVLIGMHTALQCSFGLALERTDGAQLLVPEQETQFWQRVERERASGMPEAMAYTTAKGKPTGEKVDWFLELFAKTQEADRMRHFAGVPLQPTPDQARSVEHLNDIRNFLLHFGNTSLVTEVPWLFTDVENGLSIVETLLTRTQYMSEEVAGGPIDTIADHEVAARARELTAELRGELKAARARYGLPTSEAS
jgi:hypothetical protein